MTNSTPLEKLAVQLEGVHDEAYKALEHLQGLFKAIETFSTEKHIRAIANAGNHVAVSPAQTWIDLLVYLRSI